MIQEHQKQKLKYVHRFFQIQESYPSIGEKLLKDAVSFAQTHTDINREDIEAISHSRRSLLFYENEPWIKKESNGDFNVTMGS